MGPTLTPDRGPTPVPNSPANTPLFSSLQQGVPTGNSQGWHKEAGPWETPPEDTGQRPRKMPYEGLPRGMFQAGTHQTTGREPGEAMDGSGASCLSSGLSAAMAEGSARPARPFLFIGQHGLPNAIQARGQEQEEHQACSGIDRGQRAPFNTEGPKGRVHSVGAVHWLQGRRPT